MLPDQHMYYAYLFYISLVTIYPFLKKLASSDLMSELTWLAAAKLNQNKSILISD